MIDERSHITAYKQFYIILSMPIHYIYISKNIYIYGNEKDILPINAFC